MLFWISGLITSACFILLNYAYKVRHDNLLSAQSLLIGIGLLIPTVAGLIAQVIFPLVLNRPAVPATSYFLTFLSLATLVALNRYRLFTISELLSSETLLDELLVGVVSISDTGHITYMNRSAADLFDVDRQSARKKRFRKIISYSQPADEEQFTHAYQRALDGEFVHNVESALLVNGNMVNIAVAASPIVNNKRVRGVLLCVRDITELKMSMHQTLQNELSLKKAQALSHIGNWEWNTNTRNFTWSDELYNIYELPVGSHVSFEQITGFTHPEDVDIFRDKVMSVVGTRTPVDFNYRIILPSGTTRHLNAKLQITDDKFSGRSRLFGTVQDITQQVTAEYSLQQKNIQLKQSNANLEEFVFVASHDLKEPIRKILTFSDLINATDGRFLSEKGRSYFERMTNAARRMQTMIEDLLSLSIISQNDLFEHYSLQALVSEVVQDLDLKIKEQNASVVCESLPSVNINPKQFRQLFLNLMANSLKFCRQDQPPVITIRSAPLSLAEIEQLSLVRDNSYLKIIFSDNGIGFENTYADKIFQMFQRLHGKVDYEGTGIGLALCKKVVENHRGKIIADGKPGEGATFTIVIPVVKKAQPSAVSMAAS